MHGTVIIAHTDTINKLDVFMNQTTWVGHFLCINLVVEPKKIHSSKARLLQFETEYETRYTKPKKNGVTFLAQHNVFHTQSQIGGVEL